MMKKTLVVLALLAAVVATVPWWGGCDLNARTCSSWCSIKHFNSDIKVAACRTSCSLESARCRGDEAAKKVGDFLSGH